MGGFGSGRPRKNPMSCLVEECIAIDVKDMGGGSPWAGRWVYDSSGHACEIDRGLIALGGSGSGRRRIERIGLTQTARGRCGTRWWYCCPGCSSRRGKLYLQPGGGRFKCRACHGLVYKSQREHDPRLDALADDPESMLRLLEDCENQMNLDNAVQCMHIAMRCIRACHR